MNTKALSLAAMLLGALLVALGFYQVNQYLITGATASAAIKQLGALAPGALQELTAGMSEATNALIQAILLDFVAGIILLAAGIVAYPNEKR